MTEPEVVTKIEFARILGCSRSYVTALKKADRLVLNDRGNVLVDESYRRIAETSDPNRNDVADRWAAQRGKALDSAFEDIGTTIDVHNLQKSRAKKEHYLAEQARIEFERAIGKLVEKTEVEGVISDVVTSFRQRLENVPHRLAPEIVGKDLDAIRATLKQEVFGALAEMEREFSKQLVMIGSDE